MDNLLDTVEVSDLFHKDSEEYTDEDLVKMVTFYRQWRTKMASDAKEKAETKKTKSKKKVEEENILDRVA